MDTCYCVQPPCSFVLVTNIFDNYVAIKMMITHVSVVLMTQAYVDAVYVCVMFNVLSIMTLLPAIFIFCIFRSRIDFTLCRLNGLIILLRVRHESFHTRFFCSFHSNRLEFLSKILQMYLVILCAYKNLINI